MSEERFDPVREFVQLRDQLGRAVERGIRTVTGPAGFPAIDLYEDDEALYIRTEPILGLQPDSLDISIEDSILTISGITQDDLAEATYLYREILFGAFARKVRLPRLIDPLGTKARLKDGAIHITMPKIDQPKSQILDVTSTE